MKAIVSYNELRKGLNFVSHIFLLVVLNCVLMGYMQIFAYVFIIIAAGIFSLLQPILYAPPLALVAIVSLVLFSVYFLIKRIIHFSITAVYISASILSILITFSIGYWEEIVAKTNLATEEFGNYLLILVIASIVLILIIVPLISDLKNIKVKQVCKYMLIIFSSIVFTYSSWWLINPLMRIMYNKLGADKNTTVAFSNYYGVSIGGITYIPEVGKFYIVLNKPYLFNPNYGYIYSSRDLEHWTEEYKAKGLRFGGIMTKASLARYRVDESGNVFSQESSAFRHNITTTMLPKYINKNCYIIRSKDGYISPHCNAMWQESKFMNQVEFKKLMSFKIKTLTILT